MGVPYLRDEHLQLLDNIEKSAAFISMATGNAQAAKLLRAQFKSFKLAIKQSYENLDCNKNYDKDIDNAATKNIEPARKPR